MPNAATILDSLTRIASEARPIAVLWHAALALAFAALVLGWRPSKRTAGFLLAAPLASVGVVSSASRSPFNGLVFVGGALTLSALSVGLPGERVNRGSTFAMVAGAALVAFGWVYPHFFVGGFSLLYLYAAPVGLVPCPTLAVVIGIALLADGFGARTWSTVVASMGLFYGLFGMLRLGVVIDVGLLLGAVALLSTRWLHRAAVATRPSSA